MAWGVGIVVVVLTFPVFLLGTENAMGGWESLTFLILEQGGHQGWGWEQVKKYWAA